MSLSGRVALVTGGARGIGLAIAQRLAADGARVAIADLDERAAKSAASGLGASAIAIAADVTRTADVERMVTAAHRQWGRLDIVVNNAGITGGSKLTWELTDEDWNQVIACDLTSVFLVSRAAVRSEEHTSELQSHLNLVCRLLLEKKKKKLIQNFHRIKKQYKRNIH